MSHDVLAVVYRHVEDGKVYVHTFGNDVDEDVSQAGTVTLRLMDPAPKSGVRMYALGQDQLVLRHGAGKDITREF